MFRIRKLHDAHTRANSDSVTQVQAILREQFPALDEADIEKLPDQLHDPLKFRFQTVLLVAEDASDRVRGFALLMHAPDLRFCYLDFIATAAGRTGGGIGGALYERVRQEGVTLGAIGVFLECLPDDPALCADPKTLAANRSRLRFYERYGARPIANTLYETPVTPGDDNAPYLVFDNLGSGEPLPRKHLRTIVGAILERKYADLCPAEYVDRVVESVKDDPAVIRPPRYIRSKSTVPASATTPLGPVPIPLVVNDRHSIHHERERGYVESPVRIPAILKVLEPTKMFTQIEPQKFADSHIRAVHDGDFVDYLERACKLAEKGKSIYPYVFPIRNESRRPKDLPMRAGYYCIDTFTPLNENAYIAARHAVDCTLTAAETILGGRPVAYALVRPPGHHAERDSFGGFCYLNSTAVAAHYLSRYGRVCVLDVDYHHGNGTQDIFYDRSDVLTISIHGHPRVAYPYFSGFADETGLGPGAGYNVNLALPEQVDGERYRKALRSALARIRRFDPRYLVVAAGFDTTVGDPTGTWTLTADDIEQNGKMLGALGLPTLIVQEGGYNTRRLGTNVKRFFMGLVEGRASTPATGARRRSNGASAARPPEHAPALRMRTTVRQSDVGAVRALTAGTGVFNVGEVGVSVELVEEYLARGRKSGYRFVFADRGEQVVGYLCYGPIAGTDERYDLYWIAVRPDLQGSGVGAELIARCEADIVKEGGKRIYVDTASRADYKPARDFYHRAGFTKVAELAEFYGPDDGKVIFVKDIEPSG